MKIGVGSDHRGFSIKQKLLALLQKLGHEVEDFGTNAEVPVDYPDFASRVAAAVSEGQVERGILICAIGVGMSIAANKFPGVRAATCHDNITTELSRRHVDANLICLSADLLGERLIDQMIKIWLRTSFDGGRHARRVGKIREIEQIVARRALPTSIRSRGCRCPKVVRVCRRPPYFVAVTCK